MWKTRFGFTPMSSSDAEWVSSELPLLMFPGTELLEVALVPPGTAPPLRPAEWVNPATCLSVGAEENQQLPPLVESRGKVRLQLPLDWLLLYKREAALALPAH